MVRPITPKTHRTYLPDCFRDTPGIRQRVADFGVPWDLYVYTMMNHVHVVTEVGQPPYSLKITLEPIHKRSGPQVFDADHADHHGAGSDDASTDKVDVLPDSLVNQDQSGAPELKKSISLVAFGKSLSDAGKKSIVIGY